MWGFEELIKEETSAHDDFDLIFDKVMDTRFRLASIFEGGGLHKKSDEDFGYPLRIERWISFGDQAYVSYTDPSHANLIVTVTLVSRTVKTFNLLSHDEYSDIHNVTGDVAKKYIEDLESLEDWCKENLS